MHNILWRSDIYKQVCNSLTKKVLSHPFILVNYITMQKSYRKVTLIFLEISREVKQYILSLVWTKKMWTDHASYASVWRDYQKPLLVRKSRNTPRLILEWWHYSLKLCLPHSDIKDQQPCKSSLNLAQPFLVMTSTTCPTCNQLQA